MRWLMAVMESLGEIPNGGLKIRFNSTTQFNIHATGQLRLQKVFYEKLVLLSRVAETILLHDHQ